MKTFKILHSLL